MRTGGVVIAFALAGLAFVGLVAIASAPGYAAPREPAAANVAALAPGPSAIPARADDFAAATDIAERAPAPIAAVPPTLRELVVRLRAGEVNELVLTRADIERLFVEQDRDGIEPGAAHVFVDLDGDGALEAFVVIGDGWWGKQVDGLVFAQSGDAWSLVDRWHVDDVARGTPGLRTVESGSRRQVMASWTDGWGTGYSRSTSRWLEYSGGKLVEVLAICRGGEDVWGGTGPVLEWGVGDVAMQTEGDGSTIASATLTLSFWAGEFGDELASIDGIVRMRWRQLIPGAPFAVVEPLEGVDVRRLWRLGAQLWLAKNATAARAFVNGTAEQQEALRRTCEIAIEAEPFAPASELAALLPPRPPRR